ncbi:hypothetical protein GJU39_10405 [Pedobacter petrophilus]|uniref:Uncharacterized protein n=1 Tax=Pedobacter petrophilus TaxID=1908241 RepID=A0A7K0FYP5_9SPHI|nr:hypothetical protein [Pedobacter petrophilus]MRX76502.1 hypothetical protein [Pedobacter petrophilus]
MEKYSIKYDADNTTYEFLVGQFPFRDGETCKYSIFYEGKMVASFEPDRNNILNICKNTGGFDEGLLGQLADEIEDRHPNIISCSDD